MPEKYVLAIDQGTTSTRTILFSASGDPKNSAQREFPQIFPQDGWVEHDALRIWQDTKDLCQELIDELSPANEIVAIGITNQRETAVVWDRETGEPIHNAIVWQDRRTAERCAELAKAGHGSLVQEKTGLLLDPYFSGTKVSWILDNVEGARHKAEDGKLAFGTIDSWLIWNLTGGRSHVTDATNASRTMLFNIGSQEWDDDLLEILRVPRNTLPKVLDCADDFGVCSSELFGREIPICGVAGDQQAATVGQTCFQPGMMKSTYGTGCFALLNTGDDKVLSHNKLLTTVAYRLNGKTTFALEGSIFMAGATIQWIRDGLQLIKSASESEDLAKKADPDSKVILVPAFTGLGAPYWDPHARGAILGLTRDSGVAEIVKAAIESVAFQTRDLMDAMSDDMDGNLDANAPLRVDGGMVANDWFLQTLADFLGRPVERPVFPETTALGAAYLAGYQSGLYSTLEDLSSVWKCESRFDPQMSEMEREGRYSNWKKAIKTILSEQT